MTKNEIITKLQTIHGGSYTNITFVSEVCSNKDHKNHKVQKLVSAVVRLGVRYSNIQVEEIQSRTRTGQSTERLPWGEWCNDNKCLITHKDNLYLRCTISRSPRHHRKVSYLIDGVEVTKEEAISYTRPSEWNKKEDYVYNPNISNILLLGKEGK